MASNLLMKDLQREILSQVAGGQISAAEGVARLEILGAGPSAPATATATPPDPPGTGALTARAVKVISQFGIATIVGDPSVAFAIADGPHRARQDGDTLVIEHTPLGEDDGFSFGGHKRMVVDGVDFQRRSLSVRMNPDLPLFATVQAGNISIDGVHGPIMGDVQAGNCKVADFRSPINLVVQAGNITADGRLDGGASKIRCEIGSVKVRLDKGSSVRISAHTTLGKIAFDGPTDGAHVAQAGKQVTIGAGAGTLEVDCTMGTVRLSAG